MHLITVEALSVGRALLVVARVGRGTPFYAEGLLFCYSET